MTILFGHPGGNPNSYQAALAHFEAGWLEAFCVPWLPSAETLRLANMFLPRALNRRFQRRECITLADVPKIQGRVSEFLRLIKKAVGRTDERSSYEANDWLMHIMTHECRRNRVTAVHAYEDCSLHQFQEAKRLGRSCIYDMPIGYYPAWERTQTELAKKYADWLPPGGPPSSQHVRPRQKRAEMRLADLVCAPSSFVADTIRQFESDKTIALVPYGVDSEFWKAPDETPRNGPIRFIYAGQLSLRKGTPDLLQAWRKADLCDAELDLVGLWALSEHRHKALPHGVRHSPPCGPVELRAHYQAADVLVLPSYFEGFGLVILEAMACGLPVIASRATAGPDVISANCGRVVDVGDIDALVENLKWFSEHRGDLPTMGRAARARAEQFSWRRYREHLKEAVRSFV
jgi:alpha-maltose-1-phosphate synthase